MANSGDGFEGSADPPVGGPLGAEPERSLDRPAAAGEGGRAATPAAGDVQGCALDRAGPFWAFVAALALLSAVAIFPQPVHHDVGWYLYGAERILRGARLCRDIVEFNSPMTFYFDLPAAWLGRATGLPAVAALQAYIVLVVGGALLLCGKLLREVLVEAPPAARRVLLLVLMFLFLLYVVNSYGMNNCGQREHLMFVLTMPYVLACLGRALSRPMKGWLMVLVGVLAGVGMCLKPHFVLLWVFMEAYLTLVCRRGRPWERPECWGIGVVLALFGLYLVVFLPDYFKVLRMAAGAYPAYGRRGLGRVLFNSMTELCFVALVAMLLVRPSGWARDLERALLVACLAFLGMAFAQLKGWDYHLYPAQATGLLLLAVVAVDFLGRAERLPGFGGLMRLRLPMLMVVGLGLTGFGLERAVKACRYGARSGFADVMEVMEEHGAGQSVMIFTMPVFRAFPAVNYAQARWAWRCNGFWMLPGLYPNAEPRDGRFPYRSRAEMNATERFMVDSVIADLLRDPPALIWVDDGPDRPDAGPAWFDYLEYFLRDPRFARMWKHYEPLTTLESYRVFRRKPTYMEDFKALARDAANVQVELP